MLSGSQNANMAFVKYRFIGNALLSTTCACSSLWVEIPLAVNMTHNALFSPHTWESLTITFFFSKHLKTDIINHTVSRVQNWNIRRSYLTVVTFNMFSYIYKCAKMIEIICIILWECWMWLSRSKYTDKHTSRQFVIIPHGAKYVRAGSE